MLIGLAPRLDTDLWWHLKDGAYIWSHHAIPVVDHFSFTFAGHPWTDHEWLTELLLYGLFKSFGQWGPIVAFAAIICTTFGLAYRRMLEGGANAILALFVLVGAFVASSSTWGARPQMLSLLFLAIYALVLDRYVRERDRRLLVVFPLLMVLWTNMHGGWSLGLVLLGLTLAGETANRRRHHDGSLEAAELRALAFAAAATLGATLVNPYGLRQVLYPLVWIFPSAYSNVLNEWVSSNFHEPVFMVFEAMLLVLIGAFYSGRQRFNWTHLLLILAFTHLALSQSRNVAVWSVVISPLLALYLQGALLATRHTANDSRKRSMSRHVERSLNVALLALVCVLYPMEALHFVKAGVLERNERTVFPTAAMTFMMRHNLPSRTYTSYAWGGYVLWEGYPRYQDFIDGRANTLFNTRILHDYLTAYDGTAGWKRVLNRYRTANVLVDPNAPLAQVLAGDPGWRLVYHDGTSTLYTRRAGQVKG